MNEPLVINSRYRLPGHELEWSAVRASGPGGQNVNKVASKVELRFALGRSSALPAEVKARLAKLGRNRLTQEGEIVIVSSVTRDQRRNLQDALERLRQLVLRALTVPKPRRKTKPSRGAVERRLRDKQAKKRRKAERRGGE